MVSTRDPNRIDKVLALLRRFWQKDECVDMRFWQMLSYLGGKVFDKTACPDFFYLEDDEFENFLKKILDGEKNS